MAKIIWNDIRMYATEFALVLDPKAFSKIMKEAGVADASYPSSMACTTMFKTDGPCVKRRAVVTLNRSDEVTGIQVAAALAHEAQHIVQYIEDSIGENKFSHEAECYLLQEILQDLLQDYAEIKGIK